MRSISVPIKRGLGVKDLKAFPVFCALWCRYLRGTSDDGQPMKLSGDPRMTELTAHIAGNDLKPILSDASIFGADLYEAGLGERIENIYGALLENGAVGKLLDEYCGE